VAAGVRAVMPGHLRVAGLTGSLPASLSAAAVALLRSSLGFGGAVVTDALEMRAVADPFGIPGAAVRAVAAGNDLLCLGRDVPEDGYLAVRAALAHAVGAGELPESRLAEAAERVAGLRAWLAAARRPGAGAVGGIGLAAARRALRVTGALGIVPEPHDPVVVEVEPIANMAAGDARWGLDAWVPAGSLRVAAVPDAGTAASGAAEALKAATGRSLILVVRDAHRSPATRSLVTAVLAERPDTILVEMGLPYWQPPTGAYQAYLATYGASRANAQAAAELLGLTDLRNSVAGKWESIDRKRGKNRLESGKIPASMGACARF
jgi:beta-N-acetylhexosaminidase